MSTRLRSPSRSKFDSNATIVDGAGDLVKTLSTSPDVEEIIIGAIFPFGTNDKRIRFYNTDAGFRMDVYTSDGAQQFHVYTKDREKTKQHAADFWKNHYG